MLEERASSMNWIEVGDAMTKSLMVLRVSLVHFNHSKYIWHF